MESCPQNISGASPQNIAVAFSETTKVDGDLFQIKKQKTKHKTAPYSLFPHHTGQYVWSHYNVLL